MQVSFLVGKFAMKVFYSNLQCRSCISRVLFYSTNTLSSSSPPKDLLYRRISRAGDPRVSIIPVLDQWIEEAREVKKTELQRMIKQLRKYRRFKHALELSEWMSDQKKNDLSPGDIAVHLDLISKVHGLEQAEKYFNDIPDSFKVFQVYGAILNCYVRSRSLEKAEAMMLKMSELGFSKTSLSYNSMLNLYSRIGMHEKLDTLMQEMEEKGIQCDNYTYNIRLNAYADASNIEGMEKLLADMEVNPVHIMDWNAYLIAANGYLKAGLTKQATMMLKRSETLVGFQKRRNAYEIFITLYAAAGDKDEVYRIWNLYKTLEKQLNSGYTAMISSLVKLDDIDGAERILEEWNSHHTHFDIRVPNLLISAYCRKGLMGKAEAFVNKIIAEAKEPDASTYDRLATGYCFDNQITKALELLKKAILKTKSGYKLNRFTIAACIEYLKEKGDVKDAEEFLRSLREHGHLATHVYDNLIDYINNGNSSSALDLVKADEKTLDGEI